MKRLVVSKQDAGRTVAEVLERRFGLSRQAAREAITQRRVRLGGRACRDSSWRVRPGDRLHIEVESRKPDATKPSTPLPAALPAEARGIRIVYSDAAIVVVDKPAGLTTVRHKEEAAEFGARARRFLPPTLADLLPRLLPGPGSRPRAVHRLDKETSGLVVFARTPAAERNLGMQFRAHTVERRYLVLVRGRAQNERIESYLVRDRGDSRRGSGPDSSQGQRAVTQVRVVEELGDFTLVECRLETGRTHQVRIHLGERGTPICGERIYDRAVNQAPIPDRSGFTRPALHAAFLAIAHPVSGKRIEWSSPLPKDMHKLLRQLRRGPKPLF